MLESLHVHNFALLEDARVDFSSGFNVFTGETGAGKSILIDAFGVALGNRASVDYLRKGADSYWIQAVFDITENEQVKNILAEHGIETDDELFLKRQVNASGKGRAFINGMQVPVGLLKQIGSVLVDIHGQHENQALLQEDAPRVLIDAFGKLAVADKLTAYQQLYKEYLACRNKLKQLQQDNAQQDILLDRYSWEIKEIKAAGLAVHEEKALEEEAEVLKHSEKIISSVNKAFGLLDDENSVLGLLADAKTALQTAARYDDKLQSVYESLDSAWINLDDSRQELADYLDSSNFNADRAAEVQERLDVIYRLHRKYGGSTEAVLDYLQDAEKKYYELSHVAEEIAAAESSLQKITARLTKAADVLSNERQKWGVKLAEAVSAQIHDLAMPNGVFTFVFEKSEDFSLTGRDKIKIMFSANIGEPVSDLEKVASGGELSRIALAVKTVMHDANDIATMVFDEIDTGVGGATAKKMAEKIAVISVQGQVLCITHLPQIAVYADRHINISKKSCNGRTVTELIILEHEDKIRELARMISGNADSKAAYENAVELLHEAAAVKTELKK